MSNALATTDVIPMNDFMAPAAAMENPGPMATSVPLNNATSPAIQSSLRRDQKAAIIVHLLKSGDLDLPLGKLKTNTFAQLIRATADLSVVSEAETLQVINDFLVEIESTAIYFQPGIRNAMAAFGNQINDSVKKVLMLGVSEEAPEDPWPALSIAEPKALAKIMKDETAQVCGIILSKLPSGKSAQILAELDPEIARSATLAATRSGNISDKTVMDIGLAITDALGAQVSNGALGGNPIERVAAFMNLAPGPTREKLISSIEATDPILADKMRKVMFTFADIPDRLSPKDIPKIARVVENNILLAAMVGGQNSNADTVEFFLANLSKRLVVQLKEEMEELGEVGGKEAETAMNSVISTIKDLEASNEIILHISEE